jgi:hypothetical protein
MLKTLTEFNFKHVFFTRSYWYKYATYAFYKGDLTSSEIATLMLYEEARTFSGFKIHDLKTEEDFLLLYQSIWELYNEEEMNIFAQFIEKNSCSSIFFSVDFPFNDPSFQIAFGTNIFLPLFVFQNKTLLILSPNLIYELYKLKTFDNTMRPNLVWGYSTTGDFTQPDYRDIYVPHPGVMPPTQIHSASLIRADVLPGIRAINQLMLYHHDIAYHLWIECFNVHRELWIKIASLIQSDNYLYNLTLDREFHSYWEKEKRQEDYPTIFYKYLSFLSEKYFKDCKKKLDPNLIYKITDYLEQNKAEIESKYGIPFRPFDKATMQFC